MQSRSLGSKCGKGAGKVNVLIWGDLLSGYQSKLGSDVRLRQQGSAEAIVPRIFFREGLNIERSSRLSSSQDEPRRPNASDRGSTAQTKWVKPVGVVQRVEPSSARDRGTSSARISVPFSVNRRMRTRMSWWCERRRLAAASYSIVLTIKPKPDPIHDLEPEVFFSLIFIRLIQGPA